MNDKSIEHMKRLLLFKERLSTLMYQQHSKIRYFVDKLNDGYDEPRFKEVTIRKYLGEKPSEPNIVNAVAIARELDVGLYYLFGLEQGELIYSPSPRTLLVNLFRAFHVDGIQVNVSRSPRETVIVPQSDYFHAFFDEIDLQRDFTFNKPTLEKLIKEFKETINIIRIESKLSRSSRYPRVTKIELLQSFRNSLKMVMSNEKVYIPELSLRTQLSIDAIQNYRFGKRKRPSGYVNIGINNMIDIACVLDVSLEHLLGLHKDRERFPINDTPESMFLNLFKALTSANFKIRKESSGLKVAYTQNEAISVFFKQIKLLKIESIQEAQVVSSEIDNKNLWVVNGEIQVRDRSIEKSGLAYTRFLTENALYGTNTEDKIDDKILRESIVKLNRMN